VYRYNDFGIMLVLLGLGASLMRLFRADAEAEFEQTVWMVLNLQVRGAGVVAVVSDV
jgi:hypothetical protein